MIIVLGSVQVLEARFSDALAVSQEHVQRSRLEPGCIEHGVSIDPNEPNRLVFVERWADMTSLKAHFAVPASRAFVKAIASYANAPPSISIYQADEVPIGS